MNYFDLPQPALIIAQSRSGSTFLAHCLDSHYQIACERSEPFGQLFHWQDLELPHQELALALWRRVGYRVSMFKVSYRQVKNRFVTLKLLQKVRPKIINLYRQNVLEAIISSTLCTRSRRGGLDHPIHTYRPVKQQEIKINCEILIGAIEDYLNRVDLMREKLKDFETLTLTYEQITADGVELPQDVSAQICDFLGVNKEMVMFSELTRLNYDPIITNYEQVGATLCGTDHEWMLNEYCPGR